MGASSSKANFEFIFQLLFHTTSIKNKDVKLFRKAIALFTCPTDDTGVSLRVMQTAFLAFTGTFAKSQKIFHFILQQFLYMCPTNVHINFYDLENMAFFFDFTTVEGSTKSPRLVLSSTFQRNIKYWYYAPDLPDTAIFSVSIVYGKSINDSHSVLFLLQKHEAPCFYEGLTSAVLDPGGTLFQEGKLLSNVLQDMFGGKVYDLTPEIPCTLQTEEQGGNCAQWTLLFILSIVCNPNYITDIEGLLDKFQQEPNVNILVFELYLFFLCNRFFQNYQQSLYKTTESVLEDVMSYQKTTEMMVQSSKIAVPCGNKIRTYYSYKTMFKLLARMYYDFHARNLFLF